MTEKDDAEKNSAVIRMNDSTNGLPAVGTTGSVANAPASLQGPSDLDMTTNDPDIGEEVLRRTVTV